MARDWLTAFRPASFRGARFEVDAEEFSGGRRVAVQHVAYGEAPVTEDFGRAERMMPIAAYCVGDDCDRRAAALSSALELPGPGLLVLPMFRPRMAHVVRFDLVRLKDRGGMVRVDIEFLEAGGAAAPAGFSVNAAFAAFDTLAAAVTR